VIYFFPMFVDPLVDIELNSVVTGCDCFHVEIDVFVELDLLDVVHVNDSEQVNPNTNAHYHETKYLPFENIWELTLFSFLWRW
jgi:hypothetical protein